MKIDIYLMFTKAFTNLSLCVSSLGVQPNNPKAMANTVISVIKVVIVLFIVDLFTSYKAVMINVTLNLLSVGIISITYKI